MKLALLQRNFTVGNLDGNREAILSAAGQAADQGADLAICSELALLGYPPKDLLERPGFVSATLAATDRLIAECGEMPVVFGTLGVEDDQLFNQVVLAASGQVLCRGSKQLLPNYDVFDEQRYFRAGSRLATATVKGRRIALSVCEDAWARSDSTKGRYTHDPLDELTKDPPDLLINASASPFTLGKRTSRERLFADVARRFRVPVVMVNQVGANDELIFDGRSVCLSADGEVLARAKSFEEDVLVWELGARGRLEPMDDCDEAASYRALVLGVRDYARKCGFSRAVLGLSGGIDSALVAVIAADALGPEQVLGVAMPTRYSSQGSLDDALAVAKNLGIEFRTIDIDPIFQTYLNELQTPLDAIAAPKEKDVTWENVQARIRGATVMAISNRSGALPLTTGNKSELAVGYCTLYGDMVGGLSVISDVPKTLVYRISRWLNRDGERIPKSSIEKPPSAELRPNQTDQDSLPPYPILDAILERYVEHHQSPEAIIADGFDRATVERVHRLIVTAEYKRRQAAPGLIITDKAFGSGRRLPIARAFALSAD